MIPSLDTITDPTNERANGNEETISPSTHPDRIELIFLGTGTSSSIPHVACLTAPPGKEPCRTCLSTLGPEGKKNIRRNTSAVVRVTTGKGGKKTTLVIDAGKNFQAAAVEWFPRYGLREIDGVLITHAHADAMNGLDDLRGWTLGGAIQKQIDVYLSKDTFRAVEKAFPYLIAKEFASGGGDIPDFKWHIIEDKVSFKVKDTGVQITPFSVQHGRLFATSPKIEPYFCFGFLVQDAIVYMSDVSQIPDDAWPIIESGDQRPVVVIDCLRIQRHTSHMGVGEAAEAIRRIGARRSYMTGFSHDVSHEEYVRMCEVVGGREGLEVNERERRGILEMTRWGSLGWVRPAHDGLRVVIDSSHVWDDTYDT